MVNSTITPETLSLLDTNAQTGDLVFRVCGSSRDGQIVRLKSAKCTIGSAEQCTLRLRARGIRPVHCLVLRGAGGTVVRRWDTDTRLNGRAFTDARLVPGDRLSIGRVDLEVVDPYGFTLQQPSQKSQATEYADRRQETLETQQQQLETQQQQLETQRTESESNLAEQAELLAADRAELDRRREELETERREWEEEHDTIDSQRIDSQQIDSVNEPEPDGETEEVTEEVTEEAAKEVSDDAPVDLESVLRRIGATGLLRDDEEASKPQGPDEPEPKPTMNVTTSEQPELRKQKNESAGNGEESVDEYMARLMNRVSGSESVDYPPPSSQPRRHEPAESGAKAIEPAPTASQPLFDPSNLPPRAVAPEDQAGLAAMRELANLSAGSAISKYSRNKLLIVTRAKLTMASVMAAGGGLLMWMWCVQGSTIVTFYAASTCFVIATFFVIQYFTSVGRLVANKFQCHNWNTDGKKTEEVEATTEAKIEEETPETCGENLCNLQS